MPLASARFGFVGGVTSQVLEYLIVAGGGGGGTPSGSGGGAGGLRTSYQGDSISGGGGSVEPKADLLTGENYVVTVGNGSSGVLAVDVLSGNVVTTTLTENITDIDFTNVPASGSCAITWICLLYTSPSPRDRTRSRMPSSA